MKITFHGAARNVTGSKHLITLTNGKKILLDCGLFQGMGAETDQLNSNFGFNAGEIDVLVLSHAHIDHSGLIPKLIAQGFSGVIYGTEATKELSRILLLDSAKIQAGMAECIIGKNRNGPTGKVVLTWMGQFTKFDNAAYIPDGMMMED